MSHSKTVTTQYIADRPQVCLIKHPNSIAGQIESELKAKPVEVKSFLINQLDQNGNLNPHLEEAYKIILNVDAQWWVTSSESDKQVVISALQRHQAKTSLVMPINSSFSEKAPNELPFWRLVEEAQAELITFFASQLPNVIFIFGIDVVSEQLPFSTWSLICQQVQQGLLYSPQLRLYPQSTKQFVNRAVYYAFQPQRRSVCVKGQAMVCDRVVREIQKLYQSYHFSPLEIQAVEGIESNPMLFSVIENFVTTEQDIIEQFASRLPSPSAEPWLRLEQYFPKKEVENQEFAYHPNNITPKADEYYVKTSHDNPPNEAPILPEEQEAIQVKNSQQGRAKPESENESLFREPNPNNPREPDSTTASNRASPQLAKSRLGGADKKDFSISSSQPAENNKEFNLNSELTKLFKTSHESAQKQTKTRVRKKKIHISKKSKRRTAAFYGGLAFTGVGLGALFLAAFFLVSVGLLKKNLTNSLASSFQQGELAPIEADTQTEIMQLKRLAGLVGMQANSYGKIFSLPQIDEAKQLSEAGQVLISTIRQTDEAEERSKTLVLQLLGTMDGDVSVTAEELASESLLAYENIAELNAQLSQLSIAQIEDEEDELELRMEQLEQLENGLATMKQLQPVLTSLAGIDQPRTYAVIFQNNQELRPTGGYLESVAILNFSRGSLIKTTFYSGLQLDSLLQGSVRAPDEITQFMGEQVWSVRDSNWDPHFPKTAEQVSWFLEKSLGEDIDGVITVDIDGLANILRATGPVEIPDYNEVVTDKNLAEYIEFHSEVALQEGVKDYRQLVFEKIITQMTQVSADEVPTLLSALHTNLGQQHMLISFRRSEELQAMKNLGWAGALLYPNCPSQFNSEVCRVDSIAQVEANVGVNRANYYLKRTIEHGVQLTENSADHSRQITFENTAQSESWPKGPYKVYLRTYMPVDANLTAVKVSNQPVDEDQLRRYTEHDRQVVGFYVEVPVKSTKTVSISFSTPLPQAGEFAYALFEQSQPGSGETKYEVSMSPHPGQVVKLVAPQAEVFDDRVVFSRLSSNHGFFGMQVAQEIK